MSDLQKKINQSLVLAEHQARVDCELRGGDVSEHWASIISSQLEAITVHNEIKEEECKQLNQDKAELVEALGSLLAASGGALTNQLYSEFEGVLEKHK